MRRTAILSFLCGLLLVPAVGAQVSPGKNLLVEGIPPVPEKLAARLNSYQNIRTARFADWHPRQRAVLVSTRFAETRQLHWVEQPGGARRQLTFFRERVVGGDFCRQTAQNCLIVFSDVGGAENFQIYRYDLTTARLHLLTDGKSRNGSWLWNKAGTQLAYTSTKRTGRHFDVYLLNPQNPADEKLVLEVQGAWAPLDFSPDDSRLLLIEYISINESYLHVLNLADGSVETLTPRTGQKVAYDSALFSKDGKGIYLTTDKDSEFVRLARYDLAQKAYDFLTADIPWDVQSFDLSDDGRYLVFITNEDGISKLHIRDLQRARELPAPALPPGVIGGLDFRPEASEFAFVVTSARTPTDVFSFSIATGELTRWTQSETGGLDPESFSEAELIHFPTFDEVAGHPRQLAAFLYRPGPKFKPPYPVLIDIHGGPEGQARPTFRGRRNYYTSEMGIAVIRPNVRGSAGYGKSFLQLDNGYRREDTVRDIGALLDWIEKQPYLDKNRVAVIGGSYGGYMSLATMTHYNDRLRCGFDYVGISNFVTFLKNTKDYRRDLRRVEYGDERGAKMREFLVSISPLTNAHKITKPLFIAQGLNDPRVPASESAQMRDKVRAQGGPVWYLVAKNEGHGFAKRSNQDYLQYALILFLEKFLLK
ncbi:MAG: prolyl oligopeptidase family serine peptidase [Terriglobia bacterium]